jgi:2-keto-3-deoxy-L-rhamnonate aldolase RhmA
MSADRAIELLIITNNPEDARSWEDAGIDIVFIDLEVNGKAERQAGLDAVLSDHSIEDVSAVRSVLRRSDLLVRINPFHDGTETEVDEAINRGADVIMLPMFSSADEVHSIAEMVAGRARLYPLIETREALRDAERLAKVPRVEGYHFGLNDLHLGFGHSFLFEVCLEEEFRLALDVMRRSGKTFGFGGVSTLGTGQLPAEKILRVHRALGSTRVIASRQFKLAVEESGTPRRKIVSEVKEFFEGIEPRVDRCLDEDFVRSVTAIAAQRRARSA